MLIDPDAKKLERSRREIPEVATLQADATSFLVQQEAGVAGARAVLGLTGTDEVNLEFCRVALDRFSVSNTFSVVTNRDKISQFTQLGIEVVSRAYAVSSVLQTKINPGKRTTNEVGLGAGEIIEVTVLPHSPVIGRPLRTFRARSWIAAAIYREGRLVVPHGQTYIEEGDRVLLVGDPGILPAVANFFRHGASEFPLQFGLNVLVSDPEKRSEGYSLPEAIHLTQNSFAQSLKVLSAPYQDEDTLREVCKLAEVPTSIRTAPKDWPNRVCKVLQDEDAGCLVLPGPKPGLLDWMGLGHNALFSLLQSIDRPCLLARGTFPYKKVLLVVARGEAFQRAAELAMDVTRLFEAHITATAVLPHELVGGQGHNEELREGLDQAASVGAYYSMEVETEVIEGHPVHQIVERAADFDLVVIGYTANNQSRWLTLDAAHHILLRVPCSTLILPVPG